jgi:hypothetical protein
MTWIAGRYFFNSESAQPGHLQVQQCDIDIIVASDSLDGVFAVIGLHRFKSTQLEPLCNIRAEFILIINQ